MTYPKGGVNFPTSTISLKEPTSFLSGIPQWKETAGSQQALGIQRERELGQEDITQDKLGSIFLATTLTYDPHVARIQEPHVPLSPTSICMHGSWKPCKTESRPGDSPFSPHPSVYTRSWDLSSLGPVVPDHTCLCLNTTHLEVETGLGPRRKRSSSYKTKL